MSVTTYLNLKKWPAQIISSSVACLQFDEELEANAVEYQTTSSDSASSRTSWI